MVEEHVRIRNPSVTLNLILGLFPEADVGRKTTRGSGKRLMNGGGGTNIKKIVCALMVCFVVKHTWVGPSLMGHITLSDCIDRPRASREARAGRPLNKGALMD